MFEGDIEEKEAQVSKILSSLAPGAFCIAQEWDNRVDCFVRLPDGNLIGEMISVRELSEERVRQTGERLAQRVRGVDVPLVKPIQPPTRIITR